MISIIVPVYNAEVYIEKCIKSLIKQTYKDLEIFIINDGSTDNSGCICDEYAKIDKRITVIHKENGGVSSARNIGLDNIHGDYVGFMDADDWIAEDMFEFLHKNIKDQNADVAICGFLKCYAHKKSEIKEYNIENYQYNSLEAIREMLKYDKYEGILCNKLFKSELFINLRFNTDITIHEDMMVVYECFKKSKIITYNPDIKYYYFINDNGVCNMKFNQKRLSSLRAIEFMVSDIKQSYSSLLFMIQEKYVRTCIELLMKLFDFDENYKYGDEIIISLKQYLNYKIFKSVSFRYKIYIIFSLFGYKKFNFLYGMCEQLEKFRK